LPLPRPIFLVTAGVAAGYMPINASADKGQSDVCCISW